MSIQFPPDSAFYYCFGHVFILADHPKARETITKCPDIPVLNQKTLELINKLLVSKATAEGKLRLLGDLIRHMQLDAIADEAQDCTDRSGPYSNPID
jgi:hypothetical protein